MVPFTHPPGAKLDIFHVGLHLVLLSVSAGVLLAQQLPSRLVRWQSGTELTKRAALVVPDVSALALAVRDPASRRAGIPDSVLRVAGYQHWRGAAIGGGVGAVLGGLLAVFAGKCDDCTTGTWDHAKAALVVTGGGAGVGFLAGLASPRRVWVHQPASDDPQSHPQPE
jgi:hypothetical protein